MANKAARANKVVNKADNKADNKATVVRLARASKQAHKVAKASKVGAVVLEWARVVSKVARGSKVVKASRVAVPVWEARAIRAAAAIANCKTIRPGNESGRIVLHTYN